MRRYAYDRLSVVDTSFPLDRRARPRRSTSRPSCSSRAARSSARDGGARDRADPRLRRVPPAPDPALPAAPSTVPLGNRLVWIDDDHFNIHYHVRHTSLPRPGDARQLKRLAGRASCRSSSIARSRSGRSGSSRASSGAALRDDREDPSLHDRRHLRRRPARGAARAPIRTPTLTDAPTWIPRPAPTRARSSSATRWSAARASRSALCADLPRVVRRPLHGLAEAWRDVVALGETLGAACASGVGRRRSTGRSARTAASTG